MITPLPLYSQIDKKLFDWFNVEFLRDVIIILSHSKIIYIMMMKKREIVKLIQISPNKEGFLFILFIYIIIA
jgi:hypothetical protein